MKIITNSPLYSEFTFKSLLNDINQEEAFSWFLNQDVSGYFTNPFRPDRRPGCYLEETRGLTLMWDWGDVKFKGKSIIQVIATVKNLNYQDAAYYLYHNYVLQNKSQHTTLITGRKKLRKRGEFDKQIMPTSRTWNLEDKEYWSPYYISKKNLNFEKVIPIQWYYTNSRDNPTDFKLIKPSSPTYGIPIKTRWKIYTPLTKFFHTNQIWFDIGGLQPFNSDDFIIITKSYKDYQVLVNQGYNCRYILCETVNLNVAFLKYISKEFKKVYYLMDNDMEGIKATERLVTYSKSKTGLDIYKGVYLPTHLPKDSSDFIKKYGESSFNYQLEELLNDE